MHCRIAAGGLAFSPEIEGKGITPDVPVEWSYEEALHGRDNQLSKAVHVARELG